MTGWFTRAEFVKAYSVRFPTRPQGSIIPSDYVVGSYPKGAENHAKFLESDGRTGRRYTYRFVGWSDPDSVDRLAFSPRHAAMASLS